MLFPAGLFEFNDIGVQPFWSKLFAATALLIRHLFLGRLVDNLVEVRRINYLFSSYINIIDDFVRYVYNIFH